MSTTSHPACAFPALVRRLSDLSVTKHFDAYRDVDWDAADARIDPRDPRLRLPVFNALGATDWYRSLPGDIQARLGLEWTCQTMRYGVAFERCLSHGLLEFASVQPNGSLLYRYAMHEVIEESQHSMMFQELIRRSGCEPHDVTPVERWSQRRIARCGATFPELFFFCVLSGEVFVDHDNRERLRAREAMHPLVRRIVQIHVTEEARHVCFAKAFLREKVPHLSRARRAILRAIAPFILSRGERLMLRPSPAIVARYAIPKRVLCDAFAPDSNYARAVREVVAPLEALICS